MKKVIIYLMMLGMVTLISCVPCNAQSFHGQQMKKVDKTPASWSGKPIKRKRWEARIKHQIVVLARLQKRRCYAY